MKLKGHKKGCACVGCSAATRKRGRAHLLAWKKWMERGVKGRRLSNPLSRKETAKVLKMARYASRRAKGRKASYFRGARDASATVAASFSATAHRSKARKLAMALTLRNPSSRKRVASFSSHKKGCACVFHSKATRLKGMKALGLGPVAPKTAAKRARALKRATARLAAMKSFPNPGSLKYIGSRPTVYTSSGKVLNLSGKVLAGPGDNRVTLAILGRANMSAVPLGARVVRIDYDNRAKALRAYGRVGRFRHDFKSSPVVERVAQKRVGSRFSRYILKSSTPLWRAS